MLPRRALNGTFTELKLFPEYLYLWENITPRGVNCGSTTAIFEAVDTDGFGTWIVVSREGYAARSTDYGDTWTALSRGLNCGLTTAYLRDVRTDRNGVWVVVAGDGYASRSIDNGATWSALPQGLNSSSTNFYGINTDKNGVWVAGGQNGYGARSTDNGATWSALPTGLNGPVTSHIYDFDYDDDGTWISSGNLGSCSRSTDQGLTWTGLPQGLYSGGTTTGFYLSMTYCGKGVWIAAGTNTAVARSIDNGLTWDHIPEADQSTTTINYYSAITDRNGMIMIIPYQVGKEVSYHNTCGTVSCDYGETWRFGSNTFGRFIGRGTEDSYYTRLHTTAHDGKTIMVAGSGGFIGKNYINPDPNFYHTYKWAFFKNLTNKVNSVGTGTIFDVAGNNGIMVVVEASAYASRSTDSGKTWDDLPRGLNSGTTTANIRAIDTDNNGVYVAAFESGYASRSIDDGATWTALPRGLNSGSSSAHLYSMRTDRNGVWIAGGQDGYGARSIDNGVTWSALPKGVNSGTTTAHLFSLANDGNGTWIVSLYDGHASRSIDDGATWTALPQGLNCGLVTPIALKIETDGNGTWMYGTNEGYTSRSLDNGVTWTSMPRDLLSPTLSSSHHAPIRNIIGDGNGNWFVMSYYTGLGDASYTYQYTSAVSCDNGDTWKYGPSYVGVFAGFDSTRRYVHTCKIIDGKMIVLSEGGKIGISVESCKDICPSEYPFTGMPPHLSLDNYELDPDHQFAANVLAFWTAEGGGIEFKDRVNASVSDTTIIGKQTYGTATIDTGGRLYTGMPNGPLFCALFTTEGSDGEAFIGDNFQANVGGGKISCTLNTSKINGSFGASTAAGGQSSVVSTTTVTHGAASTAVVYLHPFRPAPHVMVGTPEDAGQVPLGRATYAHSVDEFSIGGTGAKVNAFLIMDTNELTDERVSWQENPWQFLRCRQ